MRPRDPNELGFLDLRYHYDHQRGGERGLLRRRSVRVIWRRHPWTLCSLAQHRVLIAVPCCFGLRSRIAIAALALVMSLVQGFDGLIGALAHDPAKTYGPFVFAIANFGALVWLLRSPEEGRAEENSS